VSRREEIELLIDRAGQRLARGEPSYLTWLIVDHGHQDCLIGKEAKSICGVIAMYLGMPDTLPSVQSAPEAVATPTATAKGGE
jgi:cholesterol oxidase